MRAILVIVVVVLVLAWVGWVQFSTPDGDPTLRINADKVKSDSAAIVEKSGEALQKASDNINENTEPQGDY